MHMGGGENPPDISESGLLCLGLPTCPTLSGLDEDPKGRVGEGSGVPQEHQFCLSDARADGNTCPAQPLKSPPGLHITPPERGGGQEGKQDRHVS